MSDAHPIAPTARIPRRRVGSPAPSVPRVELTAAPESVAPSPVRLEATGLCKSYRKGRVAIPVLRGVDIQVRNGEFLAIIGQSGSGKSTLLHLLGTLDAPDAGEVRYNDLRIDNLPAAKRDQLRNQRIRHDLSVLSPAARILTTLENVLSPLMIASGALAYYRRRRQHVARANELLEMVGLGHRLKHKPRELSGGEMQRTAIARALVAGPDVLLADEPTGNLDQSTGEEILEILRTLNSQQGLTIVMVTHDLAIAEQADRVVRLVEGQVQQV